MVDNDYIIDNNNKKYKVIKENKMWKLVKTKPGIEAKAGDEIICIKETGSLREGNIFTVKKHLNCSSTYIYMNVNKPYNVLDSYIPTTEHYWNGKNFLVLCKVETFEPEMHLFQKEQIKQMFQYKTIGLSDAYVQANCYTKIRELTNNSSNSQTQQKENIMKENIKVELTLTPDMVNQVAPKEPKTDLQNENKKPFMAKVFRNGKHIKRLHAKTQEKLDIAVNDHLQDNQKDEVHCYERTEIVKTKPVALIKKKLSKKKAK